MATTLPNPRAQRLTRKTVRSILKNCQGELEDSADEEDDADDEHYAGHRHRAEEEDSR